MKVIRRALYALLLGTFIIVAPVSLTTGCQSTPAKIAANVSDSSKITVEAALGAWNEYIKLYHPSLASQQAVKDAYESYRAAQLLVIDTAIILKESQSAGLNTEEAQQALTRAVGAMSQSLADLIQLLRTLNVKI